MVLLMLKEDKAYDSILPEDFYPVGVKGVVSGKNQEGSIGIKTLVRVQANHLMAADGEFQADFTEKTDIWDEEEESQEAALKKLKEDLLRFVSKYQWGIMAKNYILHWNSMEELAASLSYQLSISNEEKYKIVEEDAISKRHKRIAHAVYETMEVAQIGSEAQNAQTQSQEKAYREEAIRKQIQILQDELDQMHPELVTDIRRFELKIQESEMNDTARAEA